MTIRLIFIRPPPIYYVGKLLVTCDGTKIVLGRQTQEHIITGRSRHNGAIVPGRTLNNKSNFFFKFTYI